ncbi:MAG TPA: SDR family NAD(P)-dependent oxidoreductase [Acidimicrobiia bacterium]
MSEKTVVITGSTGGLGLAAAADLARMRARVAIVGRSAEKLEKAASTISGDVAIYRSDLSLLSDVRALADQIRSNEHRVDVLINNVGVLLPNRSITIEGLESTFATNLAGHFLLTNLMSSKLQESRPSRIINVTSGGMYSQRIRPDDLQFREDTYSGSAAYARTKRAQVILTELWAERMKDTGVVVHSMHPGWAKTEGVATSLPTFNKLMKPFLRTPQEGADTIVWLASSEEAAQSTGQLWFDRRVVPTHLSESTREMEEEREMLWDQLVAVTRSEFESTSLVESD